jgi:Ser/Thr protein kinase RdoA (MazF antagonist)
VLSAETVLDAMTGAYAIDGPTAGELLKLGLNDTYLLRARRRRYILRVYRDGWRSSDDIEYELELLRHVEAKGVPVSAAIRCTNGKLSCLIEGPEGTREAALFRFAPGGPLAWSDEQGSHLAGRLLGQLHAAADDFISQGVRFQLDAEYLIDRPLSAMRPFLEHRRPDWTYLEELATRLRSRLRSLVESGLDWGPCHGDFSAKNLHVDGSMMTVFDFDFCGTGWRAYDLLPAKWHAERRRSVGMWEAFLCGYRELRSIGAQDVAAVPLFGALRHLWGMGLRATEVPFRGTSRVKSEYFDYRLASFKRWEAEHLS